MTVKTGLGFYPQNGQTLTGRIDQTSRIEAAGTYNAATGVSLGTRAVCHRIYGNFGMITGGSAWTSGTEERKSFDSGHVVLWSSSGDGTAAAPFYPAVISGTYDTQLKNCFARIEALPWGGAIDSTSTIPGASYRGTKPTEMIWLQNHEPNINSGTTYGTAAQFAGMMKHIAQLYDTWWTANIGTGSKHIKFAVCLSNPGTGVADTFYDRGNSNDITVATGARPMDYVGTDIYWPHTENSGQGPVTATTGEISFSSKFGAVKTWADSYMAGKYHVIPEFAIRMPTSPVTGGAGPDPTWIATWYAGCDTYQAAHLITSNYPVKYMCQYAAASVLSNKTAGGADNSIIPDQTTQATSYQVAGVSLRPAWTAFRNQLVAWGNSSLPNGSTPGTPSAPTLVAAPTAGQTSAQLTLPALPSNATTLKLYKDGSGGRTGLSPGAVTVYYTSGTALPQTSVYTVVGVAADGVTEGPASPGVTVTYLAAAGGTPPVTPVGLAVPAGSIGQTTATATCTPTATATGYSWVVDGGSPVTTATATLAMSGLSSGASHTVTVAAFNTYGSSAASGSVSFTTSSAPDTTAPPTPTGLAANSVTFASAALSWSAVADAVVAGATTSGMGVYVLQRSLSSVAGSGTTITPPGQTGTSFVDTTVPASTAGATTVYYTIAAVDAAGNASAFSSPITVVIPQAPTPVGPTAVIVAPSSVLTGQLFSVDGSQSSPGTSGAIASWTFNFGDGVVSGPSSNAVMRHSYSAFQSYTITLTVTDVAGLTGTATAVVVAEDSSGGIFPYTGASRLVPKTKIIANDVNTVFDAQDGALASLDSRVAINENALANIGEPFTPLRHNGCLYASVPPESVSTQITVNAATIYVVRCTTPSGAPFSTIKWTQPQASPSAVTNAWMAVYDVAGALVSPTGALTDISAMWTATGEQSFTLDGGPFDPPLGADNTDPSASPATNEFFIAFYLGTVGATHPQISVGSTYALVNVGTNASAAAPTQATIQNVPLFSTSAASVVTPLNAPASLGNLTRLSASIGLFIYP